MAVIKIYLSEDGENYVSKFPNSTKEFSSICEKGHYKIPLGWSFGGTHKTNTFQCRLSGTPYYINEFEKYKHIKVTKNGTIVFLGSNPNFKKTIEKADYYEVTATYEDYSRKFSDVLFSSDLTWEKTILTSDGWTVCNPSDTSHSLVHYLFSCLNTDNTFTLHCTYTDSTPVSYAYFKYNNKVMDAWDKCLKQNSLAYYVVNRDVYVFDILEQISGTATTIPNIESEATINEKPYVDHTLPAIRRPTLIQNYPSGRETRVYDSGTIDLASASLVDFDTTYEGTMQAGSVKVGDNQEVKAMRNLTWHFSGSHSNNPKFRVQNGAPYETTKWGVVKVVETPYTDKYTSSASGSAYDETLKFILSNDNLIAHRHGTVWMTANVDVLDYNALTKPFDETEWNGKEEKCEFIYASTNADVPEQNAVRYLNALRYASKMEAKKYNFYSDLDLALNTICVIQNVTTADEIAHHEYIRITDKVDNLDDFGGYTYTGVPYVSEQVVADNFFNPVAFDAGAVSKDFDFFADRTNVLLTKAGEVAPNQIINFTISLREYFAVPTLMINGIAQTLVRRVNTDAEASVDAEEYLNVWDCSFNPTTLTTINGNIRAIANLDGEIRQIDIGVLDVTVKESVIQYHLSSSREAITGTYPDWSDTIPSVSGGAFLWRRWKYIMSDGSFTYSEPLYLLIMADTIDKVNITTTAYYCLLNSNQIAPDSSTVWHTEAPSGWVYGKKYWIKYVDTTTYSDNTSTTQEGTVKPYTELNEMLESQVKFDISVTPVTYIYNPRISVQSEPTTITLEAVCAYLQSPQFQWAKTGVINFNPTNEEHSDPNLFRGTDSISVDTNSTIAYTCSVTYVDPNDNQRKTFSTRSVYVKPSAISATPMLITRDLFDEHEVKTGESEYFEFPEDLPTSPYRNVFLIEGDYAVVQHGNEVNGSAIEPSPYVFTNGQWQNASDKDELVFKTLSIGLGLTPSTKESISAYKATFQKVTALEGVFDNVSANTANFATGINSSVLTTQNEGIDGGTRTANLSSTSYFMEGQLAQALMALVTPNAVGEAQGSMSLVSQNLPYSPRTAGNIERFFYRNIANGGSNYWRRDEAYSYFVNNFNVPQNAFPQNKVQGFYRGVAVEQVIYVTTPSTVLNTYTIQGGSYVVLPYPTYVRCTSGVVNQTGQLPKDATVSNPARWNISDLYNLGTIQPNTFVSGITVNGTQKSYFIRLTNLSATAHSSYSVGTTNTDNRLNQWITITTVPDLFMGATMNMTLDRNGSSNFMQWNVGHGSLEVKVTHPNGTSETVFSRAREVNGGASWQFTTSFVVSAGDVVSAYFGDGQYSLNHEHDASYSFSVSAQAFSELKDGDTYVFNSEGFYVANLVSGKLQATNLGTDHIYNQSDLAVVVTSPSFKSEDHLIPATITCDLSAYSVGYNLLNSRLETVALLPNTAEWTQDSVTLSQVITGGTASLQLPAVIPAGMENSTYMNKSVFGFNLFGADGTRLETLLASSSVWYSGSFALGNYCAITPTSVYVAGASLTIGHKLANITNGTTEETDFDINNLASASLSWARLDADSRHSIIVTSGIGRVTRNADNQVVSIYLANSTSPDYRIEKDNLFQSLTLTFTPDGYLPTSDTTPNSNKRYYLLINGAYVLQEDIQAFAVGVTYYEQGKRTKGVYVDDVYPMNNNVSFGTEASPIDKIYVRTVYSEGGGGGGGSYEPITDAFIDGLFA